MGKIQPLSEEVYRKIAAGEVIERPLSVVKELVENAIDAGARQITATLWAGGKEMICVEDDGEGMAEEDVPLALQRHATSKLRTLDDFSGLLTLGFRGEALPAMAEVAEVTVRTADNDAGRGSECCFRKEAAPECRAVPLARGTAIEVRHIFTNMPVRRKFMKSEQTETVAVSAYLEQLSLAYFKIAFALHTQRKTVFSYPAVATLAERVYQVYGKEFLERLTEVSCGDERYRISGYVSRIGQGMSQKNRQFFFVNKRPVREKTLIASLNQAFVPWLERGSSPMAVLLLDWPPAEVDVNIHPAKLEIRFQDSSRVFSLLQHAVAQALGTTLETSPAGGLAKGGEGFFSGPQAAAAVYDAANRLLLSVPAEGIADYSLLGQYRDSYIVVEREGRLLVVDQHNAHERIIFERWQRRLEQGKPESCQTLFPVLLELSPTECELVDAKKLALLSDSGFEIDFLGPGTLRIKAFPALLDERRLRETVQALIALPPECASGSERFLAEMACHSAIKVNTRLVPEQMRKLLDDLFACANPHFCPHHRPITVNFAVEDVERMLKRR